MYVPVTIAQTYLKYVWRSWQIQTYLKYVSALDRDVSVGFFSWAPSRLTAQRIYFQRRVTEG